MTEENKLKIDTSVNLPLLLTIIGAIAAGSMWVATVNGKLDKLTEVVADQEATRAQIEDLRRQILINRDETLKNRRVYQGEER